MVVARWSARYQYLPYMVCKNTVRHSLYGDGTPDPVHGSTADSLENMYFYYI